MAHYFGIPDMVGWSPTNKRLGSTWNEYGMKHSATQWLRLGYIIENRVKIRELSAALDGTADSMFSARFGSGE
ncbi:hypothetical protein HHI36_002196, partial [Cryptolaemus montrouzieri]